jgi:hypothetical protein
MQASLRAMVLLGSVVWVTVPVSPLWARTVLQANGTVTFIVASSGMPELQAPGDVFASGGAVVTTGRVAGETHVAGFHLDLESAVARDLYAAGASATLRAPVGEDLSMIGFSVRTANTAFTTGNARMLGSMITIDGPVGGALTATGGEISLNTAITGDALLQGGTITFGRRARISGTLTYCAPEPVTIPAEVIPAAKVVYHKTPPMAERFEDLHDWSADWVDGRVDGRVDDWAGGDMPALPGTFALVSAFLVTLGFLVLLGGAMLAMAPQRVEALRQVAARRPALMVPLGVLGSSLLNFVPLLSWMINLLLVRFGIGALSTGVLRSLAARIPQWQAASEPLSPVAAA